LSAAGSIIVVRFTQP